MNHDTKHRYPYALRSALCALLLIFLLVSVACVTETAEGSTDTATDTDTETETETETETDTATEIETDTEPVSEADSESESDPATGTETDPPAEIVVAPERYDYFSADVLRYVHMDSSVYTDMKLTLPSNLEITDEDVQDYIDQAILFYYRTADNGNTKMTDQKMKKGDSAFIYYKGEIDGVAFDGGSNWDDDSPYELALGSGTFIPGFEDGLIDVIPMMTSREKPAKVQATFPEDYGKDELNGKTATFYVYVEYAIQYTLPEYNRDFVENTLKYEGDKDIYASDYELLTEHRAYIKKQLESQIATDVEYAKIDALWTYLTETADCRHLPQSEIDFYYDSYKSEISSAYSNYSTYYGDTFTALYPDEASFSVWYMGLTSAETWENELYELAEQLVKKDMITHAIARQEGIEEVSDEEYQEVIDQWVSDYSNQLTADELVQNLGEAYFKELALANRMLDWLMERATFTYGEQKTGEIA